MRRNTEGLGQIAFTHGGDDYDLASSAFTHANDGDTIELSDVFDLQIENLLIDARAEGRSLAISTGSRKLS